jgi:hypothetical protein
MLNKIKKIPGYFKSVNKRINKIGFFKTVNELIKYNRFYYQLLKNNGIKVGVKTVLFHTAFYTKVVNLFSEISHDELMKVIPRSITHGIYEKIKLERREITYDKHKMYERMSLGGIDIPEIYIVTDTNSTNLVENKSFNELLELSKTERVLVKPRFSNGGVGIHLLSPTDPILENHIYQAFVYNHKDIIDLQGSDYCGTIRYVIYNKSKKEKFPVAASIQMNGGKITDHMVNGGSYSASIDLLTGKLSTKGLDRTGKILELNPISGNKIYGFQVTLWKELLALVDKTCDEYAELPLIAFDVAITDTKPLILEINAGCGTVAAQFDKGWLDHPFVTDYFSVNT